MKLKLLISPLARAAYFSEYLEVCLAELGALIPGIDPDVERVGDLDFIAMELAEEQLPAMARASFVQGIFEIDAGRLKPLDRTAEFLLPDQLVHGVKYQGKTNEMVTQLAINLALRFCDRPAAPRTLLDPMAGKGTTLLWALRYGLDARGIERDPGALEALHRHVKRQTKLHRIKHSHGDGTIGARKRGARGKFVRYELGGHTAQLITGDSREAPDLLAGQRFDTLVTDLPYGVQHRGSSQRRSPLPTLRDCAPAWVASLRQGGAMVLVFNSFQPRRAELEELFVAHGCRLAPFEAPHRMSESIRRDLIVFTRPA